MDRDDRHYDNLNDPVNDRLEKQVVTFEDDAFSDNSDSFDEFADVSDDNGCGLQQYQVR